MKFKEIKNKTEAELQKMLKSNREKLRDLRFKVANKQLKNIKELAEIKKDIARILTVLNSKKGNGHKGQEGAQELPHSDEVNKKEDK